MKYFDPRESTGSFSELLKNIQKCKKANTCPLLKTRQFYFEPNHFTISCWKKNGIFLNDIRRDVMFVCESPGPSAQPGAAMNIKRCFFGSQRDHRFLEMRRKHGFKNCYVTNTVKCGVRHGVRHDISEVDNCRKFLEREIELIRPKIVVCVGGNADRTFREDILPKLNNPPEPFKVTHYAAHFNPSDKWNKEFKELRSRLAKMG